jgi:hypothetical protein
MKNSRLLYAFIYFCVLASTYAKRIEETEAGKTAALLAVSGRKASLEGVPAQEQEKVLDILRGILRGTITEIGTTSASQSGAAIALIALDDKSSIEFLIAEYQKYDNRAAWDFFPKAFQWAANPHVITYLAPDFQLNEPNDGFYGKKGEGTEFGISVPPRSIYSGTIAMRITANSPAFSPELQAWGKQAQAFRFKHPEAFRRLMRKWWEQNKEAFEKRDYQAVRSIALVVEEEPVVAEVKPTPAPSESPTPTPPSPEPTISITQLPPAPPSSPMDWVLVGGLMTVAVLAGAGIWMFLKRG